MPLIRLFSAKVAQPAVRSAFPCHEDPLTTYRPGIFLDTRWPDGPPPQRTAELLAPQKSRLHCRFLNLGEAKSFAVRQPFRSHLTFISPARKRVITIFYPAECERSLI
jgi:hypothetical protein